MLLFGFVSGHDFSRATNIKDRSGFRSRWGTSFFPIASFAQPVESLLP